MKKLLWIAGTFFLSHSWAELPCGSAKVVKGNTCPGIEVQFSLEECRENPAPQSATVTCHAGTADAVLKTKTHVYHSGLRELVPGLWAVVGTVRQYPGHWELPKITPGEPVTAKGQGEYKNQSVFLGYPPRSSSLFDLSGHFRARWDRAQQINYVDTLDGIHNRISVDFSFLPDPSVHIFAQPRFLHHFGRITYLPNSTTTNAAALTSGTNTDTAVVFHQGYLDWAVTSPFRIILGRQALAYGKERLIGAAEWGLAGRSFDALRVRGEWASTSVDLFASKILDQNAVSPGGGDRDFHGIYTRWAGLDSFVFEPYVFWLRDYSATSLSQLFTGGLRAEWKSGGWEFESEASSQFEQTHGQQGTLEVAYRFSESTPLRLAVQAFWASKDFDPLFASPHAQLGEADVLGRRNVTGMGVLADYSWTENLTLRTGFYGFARTNNGSPAYQVDGVTALGSELRSDARFTGFEWDLNAKYRINSKLVLEGFLANFVSGAYLKEQFADEVAQRFAVSVKANF